MFFFSLSLISSSHIDKRILQNSAGQSEKERVFIESGIENFDPKCNIKNYSDFGWDHIFWHNINLQTLAKTDFFFPKFLLEGSNMNAKLNWNTPWRPIVAEWVSLKRPCSSRRCRLTQKSWPWNYKDISEEWNICRIARKIRISNVPYYFRFTFCCWSVMKIPKKVSPIGFNHHLLDVIMCIRVNVCSCSVISHIKCRQL